MIAELVITIHGPVVSNNSFKGQGFHKTKAAREDTHRIKEVATVCAVGWEIPDAVVVECLCFNVLTDADNSFKIIGDALKGIAYHDDRDIMELVISKHYDREGERRVVTVMACDDRRPGRKSKPRPNGVRSLKQLRTGDVLTFEETMLAVQGKLR